MIIGTTDYRVIHYWVERELGKPNKCENCGTSDAKKFEWANISKSYLKEKSDWKRLCTSCHRRYDFGEICRRGHLKNKENIYVYANQSNKPTCLLCKKIYRRNYWLKYKK